jgi:uncharacterized protein with NRDE domain
MCLLFVARQHFDSIPLLIAFNRDETLTRPAISAHFWENEPTILAGKDLEKGGTWGGISTSGRMAFITFVRRKELRMSPPIPRGSIVPQFLSSTENIATLLNTLNEQAEDYLGFNLVCGDIHQLFHYSNVTRKVTELDGGLHGVSNALLNTPWPKVTKGIEAFRQLGSSEPRHEQIFSIMEDRQRAGREQVPRDTGMSEEKEWYRSSIFVDAPAYGTRCSTVITFHENGQVLFTEKTSGSITQESVFKL